MEKYIIIDQISFLSHLPHTRVKILKTMILFLFLSLHISSIRIFIKILTFSQVPSLQKQESGVRLFNKYYKIDVCTYMYKNNLCLIEYIKCCILAIYNSIILQEVNKRYSTLEEH